MAARPKSRGRPFRSVPGASALARLEARIDLVDDVDAPLAPHDAAILVALFQRLQRIGDLHDTGPTEGAEHRYPDARGQSLSTLRFLIEAPSDRMFGAGVNLLLSILRRAGTTQPPRGALKQDLPAKNVKAKRPEPGRLR